MFHSDPDHLTVSRLFRNYMALHVGADCDEYTSSPSSWVLPIDSVGDKEDFIILCSGIKLGLCS